MGAAGDYVPHLPVASEIPLAHRDRVRDYLAGVSEQEVAAGARPAAEAIRSFAGPEPGDHDTHHLVVTHAFAVAWLVRDALDAPMWRWVGLDVAHAALTTVRYQPDRAPVVAVLNDTGHLPTDLRWTRFPDHTGI